MKAYFFTKRNYNNNYGVLKKIAKFNGYIYILKQN
jgi:hypothetical protein